jgi:hypothetical protein
VKRSLLVSPLGFLITASAIGALYGASHLAGLREDTSILSGTMPPGGAAAAALGFLYVCLHFACVLGAPILVLGAGVLFSVERLLALRGTRPRAW